MLEFHVRPFDLNDGLILQAGLGNVSELLIVSIIMCTPVFSFRHKGLSPDRIPQRL